MYGCEIPFVRQEFQALLADAKTIATTAIEQSLVIQGTSPAGQMTKRVSKFSAWSLLMLLPEEAIPLRMALGAEIALAVLERTQLNENYYTALRRDALKYGRPQAGEARLSEDLAELQFGRSWLAHFNKVGRQVRQKIELPDPDGPTRPGHVA